MTQATKNKECAKTRYERRKRVGLCVKCESPELATTVLCERCRSQGVERTMPEDFRAHAMMGAYCLLYLAMPQSVE